MEETAIEKGAKRFRTVSTKSYNFPTSSYSLGNHKDFRKLYGPNKKNRISASVKSVDRGKGTVEDTLYALAVHGEIKTANQPYDIQELKKVLNVDDKIKNLKEFFTIYTFK